MSIKDFLFNGTWGFIPKCLFWLFMGWLICSIMENGTNDGVGMWSWAVGIIGTILFIYSLIITLKAEK